MSVLCFLFRLRELKVNSRGNGERSIRPTCLAQADIDDIASVFSSFQDSVKKDCVRLSTGSVRKLVQALNDSVIAKFGFRCDARVS